MKTQRFFNTAGPVRCKDHYCLPPLSRFDKDEILSLIDQGKYFVLHAPRQTGKTSSLLALRDYLNQEGNYRCLYINVEMAQSARENVEQGIQTILAELISRARISFGDAFPLKRWTNMRIEWGAHAALNQMLALWAARESPEPTVLLIDEIDTLIGDTLISVLRQLRAGYDKRPAHFPQSIILCGVRDVRDYRLHSAQEKAVITGGSAFNIKAESLQLGDFTQADIEALYAQHTQETGQVFEPETREMVWELTHGQPWLVNALGYEVCFKMKSGRDRAVPITADMVTQAKENLILRRETHLDQLVDKLSEDRVRRVIEPLLANMEISVQIPTDDILYVRDLGLIRTESGQLNIANRIYQEVIPRELIYSTQLTIAHQPVWYITPDGRLDMDKLLSAFQDFFREHSEHWVERFDYKEAGPQLLMQAFLQRIINTGGRIEREYSLGRRRTDLLVIWPLKTLPEPVPLSGRGQVQKTVIELKILYRSLEHTLTEGLAQTQEYMDRCGTKEGHLVIFDRNENKPWEEKIFRREEACRQTPITVWGV